MFAAPTPTPCPYCGEARTPVTCTCRGCPDAMAHCTCSRATEEIVAREGLCDGCAEAGCGEGLAEFLHCRRLGTVSGPPPSMAPPSGE